MESPEPRLIWSSIVLTGPCDLTSYSSKRAALLWPRLLKVSLKHQTRIDIRKFSYDILMIVLRPVGVGGLRLLKVNLKYAEANFLVR